MRLYLWNAQIGEAFHIPIQAVEVGLRNRVSDALQAAYGALWWEEPRFLSIDGAREDDIGRAKTRLQRQGKEVVAGQVIASLSFGFWVAVLASRYNPDVWSRHLRSSFPHLPNEVNRWKLQTEVRQVADLRNRLWHHEPIFRLNLMNEYTRCMTILSWLCPVKAAWIRPYCRVPAMMRQKP